MVKLSVVLLIALLFSGIISAEYTGANALITYGVPPDTGIQTDLTSASLECSTAEKNPPPLTAGVIFTDSLAESPFVCVLTRLSDNHWQTHGITRSSYGKTLVAQTSGSKFAQLEQSKRLNLISLSGDFYSFSPPGFILRV